MIKLQVTEDALRAKWHSLPDGWSGAGCHIRVFQHRAIESFAFACENASAYIVRERIGGASHHDAPLQRHIQAATPESFDALVAEARRWPLHHLIVEIDQRTAPQLRVRTSDWPIAPLFLADTGAGLIGSWDPADLYPFVQASGLDFALASLFLATFDCPYSQATLLAGMKCLTAGTLASWQGPQSSLMLTYPQPADITYPRPLRLDADVLATFGSILDAAVRRWLGQRCSSVAAHLSGGLDSAIVAAFARRHAATVRTYGLNLPGTAARSQRERRAELIQRYGHIDTAINAIEVPVLAEPSARLRKFRIVPWEEIYYEAFDRLHSLATAAGDDIILTGVGGDEILPLYWDECAQKGRSRQPPNLEFPDFLSERAVQAVRDIQRSLDRAPRSYLQRSTQEAIAASSAHFMRHGLWAHHPFATPELVRFCGSLPKEWRVERRLAREFLAAERCSRHVTHPAETEDFGDLFDRSLRDLSRPRFEQALEAKRLHGLEFVDPGKLRNAYRAYLDGKMPEDHGVYLYAAAILELTLEALELSGG